MSKTIARHIRIDADHWRRIEALANEHRTTPNQLLVELAVEALEHREWPQNPTEIQWLWAYVSRAFRLLTASSFPCSLLLALRDFPGFLPRSLLDRESAEGHNFQSCDNGVAPLHHRFGKVVMTPFKEIWQIGHPRERGEIDYHPRYAFDVG